MDIILIPGMWLEASSWDQVVPALEEAGHRTHALTLPGTESVDADRSGIGWQDHVDAVLEVVDSVVSGDGSVVLVGHSAGGMVAHAVADVRPDKIAHVVYVASEPHGDREGVTASDYPAVNGEIPLPDWSFFDEEMVVDLDDDLRATMRAGAIPWPERVTTDPIHLSDDRRFDVPATIIACEYPTAMLQQWADEGEPSVQEMARLRNVAYVDLAAGHWPQLTRPDDVARIILASIDRT